MNKRNYNDCTNRAGRKNNENVHRRDVPHLMAIHSQGKNTYDCHVVHRRSKWKQAVHFLNPTRFIQHRPTDRPYGTRCERRTDDQGKRAYQNKNWPSPSTHRHSDIVSQRHKNAQHKNSTMNYLSYDVISLLSSLTTTAVSNDDNEEMSITDDGGTAAQQQPKTRVVDNNHAHERYSAKRLTNWNHERIPNVPRNVTRNRNSDVNYDMEFQIRSTVHSWSFCWNRGDIIGYCEAYYHPPPSNNNNHNETRYTSVSRQGTMTTIMGFTNIGKFFTAVFQQCESYQSKVERDLSASDVVERNRGVAGYLEYSNLQIEYIPSTTINSSNNDDDRVPIAMNHAIVFGHYTLEFSPRHALNERGIFTLHLVQFPPTTATTAATKTISASLSSQWRIQSEHSSALQWSNDAPL